MFQNNNKKKEILYKQLELLAENSKKENENLIENTHTPWWAWLPSNIISIVAIIISLVRLLR